MQGSLPAGGLAFTGRELNPLDRYKRFQITHPPLLDLSWRKKGPPSSPVQLRNAVWTDGTRDTRPIRDIATGPFGDMLKANSVQLLNSGTGGRSY
jgi:hypothetical protein